MPKFQKGQSGNPAGRPKAGLNLTEKVRAIVGMDGAKLVEMWAALAYGYAPTSTDTSSSRVAYETALRTLQREASVADRVRCSQLLAERGFGKPKEHVEISGELSALTRVVHEYHSS